MLLGVIFSMGYYEPQGVIEFVRRKPRVANGPWNVAVGPEPWLYPSADGIPRKMFKHKALRPGYPCRCGRLLLACLDDFV